MSVSSKIVYLFRKALGIVALNNQIQQLDQKLQKLDSLGRLSGIMLDNRILLDRYYRDLMLELDKVAHFIPNPCVEVETDHPIALDSNDHIFPHGTALDNTRSPRFVRACENILPQRPLRYLDLGCAGGGLVLDFILRGHFAIGLEGSDYSLINQRAEWRLLPNNLFTCDIAKPFKIKEKNGAQSPVVFDVITAWELMEHIPEQGLPTLLENVRGHLSEDGFFIGSIALLKSFGGDPNVRYHETLQSKAWWEELFRKQGLPMLSEHPFGVRDFCRGGGNWPEPEHYTFETYPDRGFHFVAKKA
jgi:SAM-dependent methyltransferase